MNDVPLVATYRVQLSKDFTLYDLMNQLPYLSALGVSHLYLSPLFQSTTGSMHGYDVTDFNWISEERGGEDALYELDRRVHDMHPPMRLILDIVPNHMSASLENPYWYDVLIKGAGSQYWDVFDIKVSKNEKIKLPVLDMSLEDMLFQENISLEISGKNIIGIRVKDLLYPVSFDTQTKFIEKSYVSKLKEVLEWQHYKLVKYDDPDNSYRRFFDISGLVCLRMEDPYVYQLTHEKLFLLLRNLKSVEGIRVDHIDGLYDPGTYLEQLKRDTGKKIWVEKILSDDEKLPKKWPVEGTTGYEFIHRVNNVMMEPSGLREIEREWLRLVRPEWKDFENCCIQSKSEILRTFFPADLKRIVRHSSMDEDFISHLTVNLPIYRTYYQNSFSEEEIIFLKSIISQFDYADGFLNPASIHEKEAVRQWQQLTVAVMAKGMEDTAHYRYTPLLAVNEVGCSTEIDNNHVEKFLAWMQEKGSRYPFSLNATSTHDTKRSEDVRHRLYVLSEMPEEWMAFYLRFGRLCKKYITHFENKNCPSNAVIYFIGQTLVSVWPISKEADKEFRNRVMSYIEKALREAKIDTMSIKPNMLYEEHIKNFVDKLLNDEEIRSEIAAYTERLEVRGMLISLSVQTLKILSCGVPDIYQGSEYMELSMVDPDNRRRVDFAALYESLMGIMEKENENPFFFRRFLDKGNGPMAKLWLTQRLLSIRRYMLYTIGCKWKLTPIPVQGIKSSHFITYLIQGTEVGKKFLVVVPRYVDDLLPLNRRTLGLPASNLVDHYLKIDDPIYGVWYNMITRKQLNENHLALDKILQDAPIAVLAMGNDDTFHSYDRER